MEKMERNVDYHFVSYMAVTLDAEEVRGNYDTETGQWTRTHADGWTISGKITEDYVEWVNEFQAHHPVHGEVRGDFEEQVFATSKEGFQHFYQKHRPQVWDYEDI
jgi:hypothetical protein